MRASSGGQRSKSPTDKIRLLVADDHVTVLEGLVAIIGRQPDMQVVAAASNGREAVDLWLTNRPDVTLLDLRMPILDGVGAIQEIRRREFSARVIVLTTFDTDADLFKAILNISESTVKSHLRSIFTKLNVLSRTEAIATASRQGLVKI